MTDNVTTLIAAYGKRWNGAADHEVANPNKRRRSMEHAAENDAGQSSFNHLCRRGQKIHTNLQSSYEHSLAGDYDNDLEKGSSNKDGDQKVVVNSTVDAQQASQSSESNWTEWKVMQELK